MSDTNIEAGGMKGMFASALAPVVSDETVLQQTNPPSDNPPVSLRRDPMEFVPQVQNTQPGQAPTQQAADGQIDAVDDDYRFNVETDPLVQQAAQPVVSQTQPVTPVEESELEALGAEMVANGKIKDSRWDTVYNRGYKVVQEVAKNLGYKPDSEQIVQAFNSHLDLDAMRTDFVTASPEAPEKFTRYWFSENAPGAAEMAASLPVALSKTNPMAFQALAAPIVGYTCSQLENMAADQRFSVEDRARLADAAALVKHVTGNGTVQSSGSGSTDAPNGEVAQLRARIVQLEGRGQQQSVDNVRNEIQTLEQSVVDADVNRALEAWDKHFPDRPSLRAAAKIALTDAALRAISSNNGIRSAVQAGKARMLASGSTGEVAQLRKIIRQGYETPLQTLRTNLLKEAGLNLSGQSQQVRAVLQQGAQKTTPAGNGISPDRTQAPLQRNTNESPKDFMARNFRTQMAQPRI